jgi:hypothetical protein
MADNLNDNIGITINLVSTAMVAAATTTITTTVTSTCAINGKFAATFANGAGQATPTTDAATSKAFVAMQPNYCCAIVFGQTLAGALAMCQGPIIPTVTGVTTTVGAFILAPQFPDLPDDFCPLAYTIARTAPSAAAWTPGSSNWAASGVSCTTFRNVAQLPNRPQVA